MRDRQVPATASERAEHDEPAELEWVDELRVELEDEHLAPATMALLGLLLGELRTHPTVRGLDLGHGLHRAIRSCERIRSRWEYARGR